jgi:hypothetical protein
VLTTNARNIEWTQITTIDFQSEATQIGSDVSITSIHTASSLDFAFIDEQCEFMFTKTQLRKSKLLFPKKTVINCLTDTITTTNWILLAMNLTILRTYARKL